MDIEAGHSLVQGLHRLLLHIERRRGNLTKESLKRDEFSLIRLGIPKSAWF
jgi:hypothetical protein